MEELKNRIAVLDSAVLPFRKDGITPIPNIELASLQLRKCYELIGFAAVSANRDRYATVRRRFERDWNLATVLSTIEALNPIFLPEGVFSQLSPDGKITPHSIETNGRRISKKELLEYHGRVAELMHAANPYGRRVEYLQWYKWVCDRRDELVLLLSNHVTNVEYQRTFYLCSMNVIPDGEVEVTVFKIEGLSR